MPNTSTVIEWKNTISEFAEHYARARDVQAELYADDIMDIADDGSNDWIERETTKGNIEIVLNHEHILRSRLRVDSRKWTLAKLKPGTYGDKVQHANAAGDGNLTVELVKFGANQTPE